MARKTTEPTLLQDEKQNEYLEQRKLYIDLQHQVSQSFDKMIVTLAGGALGLSFTFIRQIVPQAQAGTIWLLGAAWVILVLALLAILFSLFTSQVGMIKAQEELSNVYFPLSTVQSSNPSSKRLHMRVGNWFFNFFGARVSTQVFNVAAITFTFLGILLLIIFTLLNISKV